jgi:thiol-disulfide isomerase/thioredoxin
MKKTYLPVTIILILIISFVIIKKLKVKYTTNNYLEKVLNNLEQIKSATYYSYESASAPYDTSPVITYNKFVKEYTNPSDTFIGSTFADFQLADTTKMNFFYDGVVRGRLHWEEKTFEIDSFHNNQLSFRPVGPPFFNYTRSIVQYALETTDSITTEVKDLGDSIQFILIIFDEAVEFFGHPVRTDKQYYLIPEIMSRYDIWISKADYLPYRMRRQMPHQTSWTTVKDVIINKNYPVKFTGTEFFPPDFTNRSEKEWEEKIIMELEGKPVPDWILKDANNISVALSDLKSKILLIEFTGIGCGPCHAAIPFLKQLVTEYNEKDFEFLSIETWSKNISVLKKYHDNNDLNYKFLMAADDITDSYQVQGVPVFFIIDENRVIRKIIEGYRKGTTDKEIKDAINELI